MNKHKIYTRVRPMPMNWPPKTFTSGMETDLVNFSTREVSNIGNKVIWGQSTDFNGGILEQSTKTCTLTTLDKEYQLADCIGNIINNPEDTRIVMTAWNLKDLDLMALPPCHMFASSMKVLCDASKAVCTNHISFEANLLQKERSILP